MEIGRVERKHDLATTAIPSESAGDHDLVSRGPQLHVAPLDRRGHHVGEPIRRAREGGHAERGQRGGVLVVVGGRAAVVEGEQAPNSFL